MFWLNRNKQYKDISITLKHVFLKIILSEILFYLHPLLSKSSNTNEQNIKFYLFYVCMVNIKISCEQLFFSVPISSGGFLNASLSVYLVLYFLDAIYVGVDIILLYFYVVKLKNYTLQFWILDSFIKI